MTPPTRLLTAGLGLALLVPAPARAAGDSTYQGRCAFDSVAQESTTGSGSEGIVYGAVVLSSPAPGTAVTATLSCEIRVNGVRVAGASASGTGAVVTAGDARWAASDTDVVELCTVVDYTSDDTPTAESCPPPTRITIPPDCGGCSYVDIVLDLVSPVWPLVDPTLCATVATLAPGAPPVAVTEEGDLSAAGEPLWDCPPYS